MLKLEEDKLSLLLVLDKIFETDIECSMTMLGTDKAKLIVYQDRLVFENIKNNLEIPKEILIGDIKTIKYALMWYFDFRIDITYQSGQDREKKFSFVTCRDLARYNAVSMPIKTYKVYRLIKKLMKQLAKSNQS